MSYIYLLIILVIIISFTFYKNNNLLEGFTTKYYKCVKYGNNKITNDIFEKESISRSYDSKVWDFYMPCGYNLVERELRLMKIYNDQQKIFAINGCDYIVSKNGIWSIINNIYGRDLAKKLMPETFVLDNSNDMILFKQSYSPNNIYLMKKNIQRKLGIKLTKNINEILNNTDKKFRVVQLYIDNLYLINSRKINLRIYLLIICHKSKIEAYVHKQGKCIYTNLDYHNNDLNPERHLTSLNVTNDIYNNRPQTFQQLREHLGNLRYNILFKCIYNNLVYVLKASFPKLCQLNKLKNNLTFQLFGLDYIFTNNMHPYLLEMNKGPEMNPINKQDYKLKSKVLYDTFQKAGIISNVNMSKNDFFKLFP